MNPHHDHPLTTIGTRSPFDSTPEDVVIHMIGFLVPEFDAATPYFKTFTVSSVFKWLLSILSVSSRLRDVALRSPKLWTWIPVGYDCSEKNQRWLDLCFERSQLHPLNLLVNICSPWEINEDLFDCWLHRVRTIRVEIMKTARHFPISKLALRCIFRRNWPLLEELSVSDTVYQGSYRDDPTSAFSGASWPDPWLWHGAAGSLTSLDVDSQVLKPQNCLLPFERLQYLKLRHFEYMASDSYWQPPPLPRIEELSLWECSDLHPRMLNTVKAILLQTARLRFLRCSLDCSVIDRSSRSHVAANTFGALANQVITSQLNDETLRNQQASHDAILCMDLPSLDAVEVEGDILFMEGILSILPDPRRLLKVRETKPGSESGSASSAALLTRALAYLAPADRTNVLPSAQHVTALGPGPGSKRYTSLCMTPSLLPFESSSMRRVSVFLLQEFIIDMVSPTGSHVQILPHMDHKGAFSIIAALQSQDVEQLTLPEWDVYWTAAVGSQRLLDLEIFLSDLVWQQRPLKTLALDSMSEELDGLDTLTRWLEEGLIERVVFKGQVKTIDNLI